MNDITGRFFLNVWSASCYSKVPFFSYSKQVDFYFFKSVQQHPQSGLSWTEGNRAAVSCTLALRRRNGRLCKPAFTKSAAESTQLVISLRVFLSPIFIFAILRDDKKICRNLIRQLVYLFIYFFIFLKGMEVKQITFFFFFPPRIVCSSNNV